MNPLSDEKTKAQKLLLDHKLNDLVLSKDKPYVYASDAMATFKKFKIPEKAAFKQLALGTKFQYIEDPENTFVKITDTDCALWKEEEKTTTWIGQMIYSFDEKDNTDKEVIVL